MAETVAFPYWSPDGSRIAYLCCSDANASLWVMDADGSTARQLTSGRTGSPSWSPDGTRIAFSINDGVEFDLYVMDADGSDRRRLAGVMGANGIANDCCPAWRP